MIRWFFLDTGKNTGQFNMDFDLQLVEIVSKGKIPHLRFYQWDPYAISLGYHQNIESINLELCRKYGIDVVYRPTGGRAILHAEELTYSIVMPLSFTPNETYYLVNRALIEGFRLYDDKLRGVDLEKSQIDFKNFYKSSRSIPCFSSSAKNEIKYTNKKLVGSAQRVNNDVVLQHGSILIGEYHKKLADYLVIEEKEKELLRKDLNEKTISLKEILDEDIDIDRLKESIKKGFEKIFEAEFIYHEYAV